MSDRPSWEQWGLGIAKAVATRADCSRRQVGAVIVTPDHTIVSTGYNGSASGGPSCLAGRCPRGTQSQEEVPTLVTSYDTGAGACIALHAEQNAIIRASIDEMRKATLYVTCEPCPGCARMITGTSIERIVWPLAEDDPFCLVPGLDYHVAGSANGKFTVYR